MNETEQTIYVAVLVVEHTRGTGKELDQSEPGRGMSGVRANLVGWLDEVLVQDPRRQIDRDNFYAVRDVTLYSDDDFYAELRDHGSIAKFPLVDAFPLFGMERPDSPVTSERYSALCAVIDRAKTGEQDTDAYAHEALQALGLDDC